MTRAYYSTAIDRPAGAVWDTVRDFGYYEWAGSDCETTIEAGLAGDVVGAVRASADGALRQQLLVHSDTDRSYTYRFLTEPPLQMTNDAATIKITPVVDGDRSFVEWSAIFDAGEPGCCRQQLETSFAQWLDSLSVVIERRGGRSRSLTG